MLLAPVVAVFATVKFSASVGLVVFAFVPNVVVKSEPFNVIAGIVKVPVADKFVALTVPINVEELIPTSRASVEPE